MATATEVIDRLKHAGVPANIEGMKRFGIDTQTALGVPIPVLRKMAREIKKDHTLALQLWETGVHEARVLASMIDDPKLVTRKQMDTWVKEFASWDVCDQVCGNLFDRTDFAIEKAIAYTTSKHEYIKRAGFVLMAEYAIHRKDADNTVFVPLFAIMEREAYDERNFVKKAINWALRQIGKRNKALHTEAVKAAKRIALQPSKSAKWIASNALAELRHPRITSNFQ